MPITIDEGAQKIAQILTRDCIESCGVQAILSKIPMEKENAVSVGIQHPVTKAQKENAIRNAKPAREEIKAIRNAELENPGKRICTSCGLPFDAYKHGCVNMPICKTCLGNKISERRHGGLMQGMDERSGKIAIDFSDDSALLDKLAQTAKRERRTLQQQVLYVLERWAGA